MSRQDDIEVKRRRKGPGPAGRAEAPRRETEGGDFGGAGLPPGGGFPRSAGGFPSRGTQIGGGGSIVVLLIIVAFYLFSGGQIDLTGGGADQPSGQGPDLGLPQEPSFSSTPVSNFTPSGAGFRLRPNLDSHALPGCR